MNAARAGPEAAADFTDVTPMSTDLSVKGHVSHRLAGDGSLLRSGC